MALNYTKLGGSNTTFQSMIQRFGVVTVMNVEVYEGPTTATLETWKSLKADAIINSLTSPICKLDTLKIANVSEEGPTKTVTGGQYTNPLIKYGKTARLEMQDALGNAAAIENLCGGLREANDSNLEDVYALHFGQDFEGPKTLVGDTFFIDQHSGQQVKTKIIFYQFLPDSLFNLTQDAEGDATVFDMNGDLLTTDILVSKKDGTSTIHGIFYSVVDPILINEAGNIWSMNSSTGVITISTGYTATLDGASVTSETTALEEGTAGRLVVTRTSDTKVVVDTIITR